MIKGDKIKLIHKMGVFDNIGEICEVTDIQEGGVICFKFGGCHLGCMSYDEYEKYFEKVETPVKRTWSEWSDYHILHLTDLLGIPRNLAGSTDIMERKFKLEVVYLKWKPHVIRMILLTLIKD